MAPHLHVGGLDLQWPEENVREDGRHVSYRELCVALADHEKVLKDEPPSQVVNFVVLGQDLGKASNQAIVWRLGVGQVLAHEAEHGVLRELAQWLLHVLEHALNVAAYDAWVLNSLQVLVVPEGHMLFQDVNLAHLGVIELREKVPISQPALILAEVAVNRLEDSWKTRLPIEGLERFPDDVVGHQQ